MDYDRKRGKFDAVREAESSGEIADSMDVRKALMQRVHAGEISLAEAQAQLKKIKRNAGKTGQTTRSKVFRGARRQASRRCEPGTFTHAVGYGMSVPNPAPTSSPR